MKQKKLRKKRLGKIEYTEGSDNVFADLGVPNPEKALAKSQLAWEISKIKKKKNYSS